MSARPTLVDQTPLSEFVGVMIAAHQRRLRATSVAEKRAIEREMEGCFLRYMARTHAEEQQEERPRVPRATRRRRARPGRAPRYAGDGVDYKLAQAGDREDD